MFSSWTNGHACRIRKDENRIEFLRNSDKKEGGKYLKISFITLQPFLGILKFFLKKYVCYQRRFVPQKSINLQKLKRFFLCKKSCLGYGIGARSGSGTIIPDPNWLKSFVCDLIRIIQQKPTVTYCSQKYGKHKIWKCLYTACKGSISLTM